MAKRKELGVEAWRKQLPAPTPANRALEARFLEQHRFYGGRIHEVTVEAFVAALDQGSDVGTGHSLFLRLFAEYVTALETLGAWGWAIRGRRELPLVLDGLLSYPHSAPRLFYLAARRNRSGSLIRLLALPNEHRLIPALRAGFPN